jgi:Ca2+-binding RTX toxin-like protein
MLRKISVGLAVVLVSSVVVVFGAAPASAAPFTGGFSPTIYGSAADLNGDGVVDGTDDANAFYGDTSIIDGELDCDAWNGATGPNDGTAGDGTIDASDDCTLIGVDGTPDGVTIVVTDGGFATADAVAIADGTALPTVFNAGDPDNPGVGPSDFAWSTIDGRVDSNGDEAITGDDCHFGVVGSVDILGNLGTNECGFATPPDVADNGLVDLNGDQLIGDDDICIDGCFFGLDVILGEVTDSDCTIIGTSGRDQLNGTPGEDVICGLAGNDRLVGGGAGDTIRGAAGNDRLFGRAGRDLIKGGRGDDLMSGNRGRDRLFGDSGVDTARGGPGRDRCVSAAFRLSCER